MVAEPIKVLDECKEPALDDPQIPGCQRYGGPSKSSFNGICCRGGLFCVYQGKPDADDHHDCKYPDKPGQ